MLWSVSGSSALCPEPGRRDPDRARTSRLALPRLLGLTLGLLVGCGAVAVATEEGGAGLDEAAQATWHGVGPGPHPVTTAGAIWTDPARDRPLPVAIHRPIGVERPPVVLFSHGLGGSRWTYWYLGSHLASHGYCCVHPSHPGSDSDAYREGALSLAAVAVDPSVPRDRILDLVFLVDLLREHGGEVDVPQVDGDRIAVAGHSLGAHAALALVGQESGDVDPDERAEWPAVTCAVALSPLGPGFLGLHPDSWRGIEAPVLFVTGTEDTSIGTADWRLRRIPFERSPAGGKLLAVIDGARHHAFGDYSRVFGAEIQRDPRHHAWIENLVTAFLEVELRSDPAAAAWLDAGGPDAGAELRLDRR